MPIAHRFLVPTLAFVLLCNAAPAFAVTVNAACREVGDGRTILLLDLTCKDVADCWPDPDDVDLIDAATGQSTGWAVSDMVRLDAGGRVLDGPAEKYPVRAIWDMGANIVLPETVRLEYDGEALTPTIVPEASCTRMPEAALDALRIVPGKP